jgi:hypothetical protein
MSALDDIWDAKNAAWLDVGEDVGVGNSKISYMAGTDEYRSYRAPWTL